MNFNREALEKLLSELKSYNASLVAVSKTKPVEAIREVYDFGHKVFGENYVQELVTKAGELPADIQWHYIGHLQSNKVKQIAGFVSLIHGVDSLKLLKEINKQRQKTGRAIDCLLQVHIAREETKFGLSPDEAEALVLSPEIAALHHIRLRGLMGMATLTDNTSQVRREFRSLRSLFDKINSQLSTLNSQLSTLSMGMTSDYHIALEEGSTMVRIGSAIFGERD